MTECQVTRRRELPSMVAARAGGETLKAELAPRSQEAIDETATRLGDTDAGDHPASRGRGLRPRAEGTSGEVLDRVIAVPGAGRPDMLARGLDGLDR